MQKEKEEANSLARFGTRSYSYGHVSGSNSAVECQLPKLDVAGSIPVSRSNLFMEACLMSLSDPFFQGSTRIGHRKPWRCGRLCKKICDEPRGYR